MQQLQVTVTDAKGAVQEQESILSIRAASSRRQGAVQIKRPLHFPVRMAEAAPFKVDVLRKVGEGELKIRAEDEDYDCKLCPLGSTEMAQKLKLSIRTAPQLCGRTRQELKVGPSAPLPDAPAKEPPAAVSAELAAGWQGAAAQARQYFDNHNVMRLVQALLEALIRDQPSEPFLYIGTFMDRLSEALQQKSFNKALDDTLEDGTIKGPDTSRDDAVAREQNPEWAALFDAVPKDKDGKIGVDDFCTAIRSVHAHLSNEQARALCKGIARGDTGVNLAGFCAAANSVAEGDAMAAEVAGLSAAKFAELATSSQAKDIEAIRDQMKDLLVGALEDGRLERSLSDNAFEKVRTKAASTLSKAAQDGSLEMALDGIKQVPKQVPLPTEQVPANPPPPQGPEPVLDISKPEDLDQTRQKVKAALVSACEDGRLHETLGDLWKTRTNKSVNQDELDKIREKAKSMLLESAANGRLHAELSSIKSSREGQLQQAELMKIYDKLRNALIEATDDGRLQAAVKTVREASAQAKLDALKKQATDTLTKAFYDGRLADALQESKQVATRGLPQAAAPTTADFEQVRLKTKQMLTAACEDGSLEKALRESSMDLDGAGAEPQTDVADLVRDLLVTAAIDGRLEDSLKAMAEPGVSPTKAPNFVGDFRLAPREFWDQVYRLYPDAKAQAKKAKLEAQREKQAQDKADMELANLQSKILTSLVAANKDGSLQQTLRSLPGKTWSGSPTDQMFDSIDANKDNMISREEFKQALQNGTLADLAAGRTVAATSSATVGATISSSTAPAQASRALTDPKQPTRDRMTISGDTDLAGMMAQTLSITADDKYGEVRKLAKDALVQAVKEGRMDAAVRPEAPRRRSGTRLTDNSSLANVSAATGSTSRALPGFASAPEPAQAAATPAQASPVPPQALRQADLLQRQKQLLEQKQAYEAQLAQLKAKKGLAPVPPSGAKPSSKRPIGGVADFKCLKEVNGSLNKENARLNEEMARLLARLAQSGITA